MHAVFKKNLYLSLFVLLFSTVVMAQNKDKIDELLMLDRDAILELATQSASEILEARRIIPCAFQEKK
jgi:hypothetical protein